MKLTNRQGDVGIFPIAFAGEIPTPAIPRDGQNRVILAAGEVTGHHHAILDADVTLHEIDEKFADILRRSGIDVQVGDRLLDVRKSATLVHEEHTEHILTGRSIVRIQREYVPQALPRRVAD